MNHNQYTELLDAYFEGNLSDEQQKEFDHKKKTDSEFVKLVENGLASIKIIEMVGREDLRAEFRNIHDKMISNKSNARNSLIFRIAAIFIGIISVSVLVWYSLSPQLNYGRLYADNFEPYTNLLTVKGETKAYDEQSLMNNAMYQYDMHNYQKANIAFQRLLDLKKNNDTVLFYYGISKLGSGNSKEAIKLLEELESNETSLFSRFGHVKWYLALAYLKNVDEIRLSDINKTDDIDYNLEKCIKLLNKIIIEKGDYSDEAILILEKLEN